MPFTDFLGADVPLVKTFALRDGEIDRSPYPMVRDFTSYRRITNNLLELHAALEEAAAQGWCLLKGTLTREIVNESRAGLTNQADSTQIFCLDIDGVVEDSIEVILEKLRLNTYWHTIQWSASSHLPGALLRAHVFFWLSSPVNPQLLKSWIMNECLTHFASSVTLTKSGAALHWPLDPSIMDNSRLVYIAPPVLHGLSSQISGNGFLLVKPKGATPAVPSSFFNVNPQAVNKAKIDVLNNLRKASGYTAIRDSQFKTSSGQLYLSKPGAAMITGRKVERGFVYLNLNGGDSWGYYHPEDNPEYIYNFKGEPIYRAEELLPDYWASLKKVDPQRSVSKVIYFICRDFRTDRLYNGMFYREENRLEMARAANEGRLKGFMKQHGQPVPDFVPDFLIEYNPHNETRFDLEKRYINTYVPSPLYALAPRKVSEIPPTIARVITSAVGSSETFEHFIHWLADILQHRRKLGTAWVLHGIEGTGKGVIFHRIITPLLGRTNVVAITARELDSTFNGYLEHAQVVYIDEIQLPALRGHLGLAAGLRSFITEPTIAIRRMYSEPYTAASYCNFILASNMPDPVIIPATDRRFHVGTFQGAKLAFSETDEKTLDGEVEDFYHYLMGLAVTQARSRVILESADRTRIQQLSMTAADEMAAVLIAGDLENLVDNLPQRAILPAESAYAALVKQLLTDGKQRANLTRDELCVIFRYRVGDTVPESPNKFTTYLRHHHIDTKKVWKTGRAFYGASISWKQTPEWMAKTLKSLQPPPGGNVTSMRRAKIA